MRSIETKKTITYRWWSLSDDPIPEDHKDILEDNANKRISEMMEQGYVCGDLHEFVEDGESGVEYSGHWICVSEIVIN